MMSEQKSRWVDKDGKIHALYEWLDRAPENVYDPCPCGCGTKFRYVIKGGDKELEKHYQQFIAKLKEEYGEDNVINDNTYVAE